MLVLAMLAAGALAWSLRPGRFDGWIETTGTVVALDRHISRDSDGDRRVTYALVVEYADEDGALSTGVSSMRTSNPKPVGATVSVKYPPGEPWKAQFDDEGTWFGVLFFGIWAGVLGILGTAFTIVGVKARDRWTPLRTADSSGRRPVPDGEDTSEPTGPLGSSGPGDEPAKWPLLPPSPSGSGDEPGEWPLLPHSDDR